MKRMPRITHPRRTTLCLASLLLGLSAPGPGTAQIEVTEASIGELQRAMSTGETTSVEITSAYLARIRAYDQAGAALNAMIRINPAALAEAEALDRERAMRGPRGPLHGIPVILKDNYDLFGMPSTASTLGLAGLMPPDDAFQVRKLREAGAVFIGKSNLHELARGITTISSLGGQTLNPYDLRRNPGGSSGGTGAAVAASFAAIGWGSDTCGSIRIPSSHNNLVGLRPTKGLSSIDGIVPLSHTQDTGGPLARRVRDLAIALDATIGYDPADPATEAVQGRLLPVFADALDAAALEGARIGILEELFAEGTFTPASDVVRAAIAEMVGLGADTVTVEIPELDSLLANSSVIRAEFETDFAAYLTATPGAPVDSFGDLLTEGLVHEGLTSRMGRRIPPGERDEEAYQASLAKRAPLAEAVVSLMNTHRLDAIVYPTMREIPSLNPDPQRGGTCQIAAHAGLPAISVPAGFTPGHLPIGMELLARPFEDARLVTLAYAFEQGTDHRRMPPSTPPLVNGLAPPPVSFNVQANGQSGTGISGRFTFDPVRSTLAYEVGVTGVAPEEIHGIALRASDEDDRDVVVHRISGPGQANPGGTLVLTPRNRARFEAGELHLEAFTRAHPLGAARAKLSPRE
jgi:Asp-tRNA(Asn)/Glu-tRNA(Gln) amidotransferase A subunit family amidase